MGTTVPLQPIAAVEINLDKLFTDEYEFVIPEYQRPYTWGVEHAVQLLVDLQEALERDLDEPYFLGSIVLVKDAQSPRAEVIDGQQRLVTLTLLLALVALLLGGFVLSVLVEFEEEFFEAGGGDGDV